MNSRQDGLVDVPYGNRPVHLIQPDSEGSSQWYRSADAKRSSEFTIARWPNPLITIMLTARQLNTARLNGPRTDVARRDYETLQGSVRRDSNQRLLANCKLQVARCWSWPCQVPPPSHKSKSQSACPQTLPTPTTRKRDDVRTIPSFSPTAHAGSPSLPPPCLLRF